MDELIGLVEEDRFLDEGHVGATARRLGVSAGTVHRRYREAIRPLIAPGVVLSVDEQQAIAASPDWRTAVAVLHGRGRQESAVKLIDAIARCPGRLLLELRRRDRVGPEVGDLRKPDESPLQGASQQGSEA